MDVGALRHRVTIQTAATTADPLRGQASGAPTVLAQNVPAAIEPLEGRELLEAQQLSAVVSHRVRLRYLAGVTPRSRVLFGARTFEVASVINVEERNVELRLFCQEIA
jgi:SPP1 family predicted phage head-tail adaptor